MSELALVKKDTVDVVAQKVREFQERGELHLPANYSPENAMKSAWLILQSTKDKDGKPVLQSCTRDSIANSLLDMVIQGLNPAKKQGYFIAYGNTLVFQRSYFGTMAVTKRVTHCLDIFAEAVYENDEFEYAIELGNKRVTKHVQNLKNVQNNKVVAAYCTIIIDDQRSFTEIMTIDEIKKAWAKSQTKPITEQGTLKEGSVHALFTAEMAKKTVINRACKAFVNSSMDDSLVIRHFNRADEVAEEAQFEEEAKQNANAEVIDVEYHEETQAGEEIAKQSPSPPGPGF